VLEPNEWESVLSGARGTIYRGTECISSNRLLDLLGRNEFLLGELGWHGPRALRISGSSPVRGYWRVPYALPANVAGARDNVGGPVEVLSGELPAELERVTRLGLGAIAKVLTAPFDPSDANLTRS
jgi:hypothetical protein